MSTIAALLGVADRPPQPWEVPPSPAQESEYMVGSSPRSLLSASRSPSPPRRSPVAQRLRPATAAAALQPVANTVPFWATWLAEAAEPMGSYLTLGDAYEAWRVRECRQMYPRPRRAGGSGVCFLCRFGDRATDAGELGTQKFAVLQALIEHKRPTRSTEELVYMIVRYVELEMAPLLRMARPPIELPPPDTHELYIHLSTSQHTTNSRLWMVNELRRLESIKLYIAQFICPSGGRVPDFKALKAYLDCEARELSIHKQKATALLFGVARPDDLNIEMRAAATSRPLAARMLRRQQPLFLTRFLERMAAEEDEMDEDVSGEAMEAMGM